MGFDPLGTIIRETDDLSTEAANLWVVHRFAHLLPSRDLSLQDAVYSIYAHCAGPVRNLWPVPVRYDLWVVNHIERQSFRSTPGVPRHRGGGVRR